MKSFVKQNSLHITDAVSIASSTTTTQPGRCLKQAIPHLIKDKEGLFIGNYTSTETTTSNSKEGATSPLSSPNPSTVAGSRTLRRQDTFDTATSSDHDDSISLDYDTASPQQSPRLKPRSLLLNRTHCDDSVFSPQQQQQHLTITHTVRRKRSKSELIPKMAELVLPVPVSTVLTDTEEPPSQEEFTVKERTSKYRTSLKKAKKITSSTMRKRAKSLAEETYNRQREGDSITAPPPSPRSSFRRRKTSIFRGKNKDNNHIQRTQSVPNELLADTDSLCVPTTEGLSPSERKPSWSSFKEAINSTLKSPRLSLKSPSGDDTNSLSKMKGSFDDIMHGLKMEIAKSDDPVLFTKVNTAREQHLFDTAYMLLR